MWGSGASSNPNGNNSTNNSNNNNWGSGTSGSNWSQNTGSGGFGAGRSNVGGNNHGFGNTKNNTRFNSRNPNNNNNAGFGDNKPTGNWQASQNVQNQPGFGKSTFGNSPPQSSGFGAGASSSGFGGGATRGNPNQNTGFGSGVKNANRDNSISGFGSTPQQGGFHSNPKAGFGGAQATKQSGFGGLATKTGFGADPQSEGGASGFGRQTSPVPSSSGFRGATASSTPPGFGSAATPGFGATSAGNRSYSAVVTGSHGFGQGAMGSLAQQPGTPHKQTATGFASKPQHPKRGPNTNTGGFGGGVDANTRRQQADATFQGDHTNSFEGDQVRQRPSARGDIHSNNNSGFGGPKNLFVRVKGNGNSEDTLRQVFSQFGNVSSASPVPHKGVAYITMETHEAALEAVNRKQLKWQDSLYIIDWNTKGATKEPKSQTWQPPQKDDETETKTPDKEALKKLQVKEILAQKLRIAKRMLELQKEKKNRLGANANARESTLSKRRSSRGETKAKKQPPVNVVRAMKRKDDDEEEEEEEEETDDDDGNEVVYDEGEDEEEEVDDDDDEEEEEEEEEDNDEGEEEEEEDNDNEEDEEEEEEHVTNTHSKTVPQSLPIVNQPVYKKPPLRSSTSSFRVSSNVHKEVRAQEPGDILDGSGSFLIGTCRRKCPDVEIDKRYNESAVHLLERTHPRMQNLLSKEDMMVKSFMRSSAGLKLDIPEIVRPQNVLVETLDYLWNEIIDIDAKGPDPRFRDSHLYKAGDGETPTPAFIFAFLSDRTRSIRKDFSLQGYMDDNGPISVQCIRVFEECARMHIMADEMLCENTKDEGHDETLNRQEANNCLKALNGLYSRAHRRKSNLIQTPKGKTIFDALVRNEAEFRSYYIILQSGNKFSVANYFKEMDSSISHQAMVQMALRIVVAFQTGNYTQFMFILKSDFTPYLIGCLMHGLLNRIWKDSLLTLDKAINSKGDNALSYDAIAKMFLFEDAQHARDYCLYLSLPENDESRPILGQRKIIVPEKPFPRRVMKLVESKRISNMDTRGEAILELPPRQEVVRGKTGTYVRGSAFASISKPQEAPVLKYQNPAAIAVAPPKFEEPKTTPSPTPTPTAKADRVPTLSPPPVVETPKRRHSQNFLTTQPLSKTPSQERMSSLAFVRPPQPSVLQESTRTELKMPEKPVTWGTDKLQPRSTQVSDKPIFALKAKETSVFDAFIKDQPKREPLKSLGKKRPVENVEAVAATAQKARQAEEKRQRLEYERQREIANMCIEDANSRKENTLYNVVSKKLRDLKWIWMKRWKTNSKRKSEAEFRLRYFRSNLMEYLPDGSLTSDAVDWRDEDYYDAIWEYYLSDSQEQQIVSTMLEEPRTYNVEDNLSECLAQRGTNMKRIATKFCFIRNTLIDDTFTRQKFTMTGKNLTNGILACFQRNIDDTSVFAACQEYGHDTNLFGTKGFIFTIPHPDESPEWFAQSTEFIDDRIRTRLMNGTPIAILVQPKHVHSNTLLSTEVKDRIRKMLRLDEDIYQLKIISLNRKDREVVSDDLSREEVDRCLEWFMDENEERNEYAKKVKELLQSTTFLRAWCSQVLSMNKDILVKKTYFFNVETTPGSLKLWLLKQLVDALDISLEVAINASRANFIDLIDPRAAFDSVMYLCDNMFTQSLPFSDIYCVSISDFFESYIQCVTYIEIDEEFGLKRDTESLPLRYANLWIDHYNTRIRMLQERLQNVAHNEYPPAEFEQAFELRNEWHDHIHLERNIALLNECMLQKPSVQSNFREQIKSFIVLNIAPFPISEFLIFGSVDILNLVENADELGSAVHAWNTVLNVMIAWMKAQITAKPGHEVYDYIPKEQFWKDWQHQCVFKIPQESITRKRYESKDLDPLNSKKAKLGTGEDGEESATDDEFAVELEASLAFEKFLENALIDNDATIPRL